MHYEFSVGICMEKSGDRDAAFFSLGIRNENAPWRSNTLLIPAWKSYGKQVEVATLLFFFAMNS